MQYCKFSNTLFFLFSNKMLVFRARIHKMLVRIASSADPDQTATVLSDVVLHCFLGLFGRHRNFRTFTLINSFVYFRESLLDMVE